ncbi:sugar phosphate nucleotidyltransferase [Clostridium sp. CF012]|uniref:sugar phosphate nucleotidyltransferase n=1 Tax=Clostridium sp. CF012 TaxID=2843319 RepID=UPI001C0D92C8|nr:NDP-sugar synthase [Clostridium sp. CF012]MBU3145184.1 NDP-sugar synthase [Clostridium sp. CF012]
MKALFLVDGVGTNLEPLTDDLPKSMIPMMAKPLLERNILKLKDYGVDEVILSTGHKPQKIEKYFGDGTKLGLKIHYIGGDITLGTGGAIKNAEEFFNDTFIVFTEDILSDINIEDMMKFHKEKCASVTIAVTKVENPFDYDVIEYNENLYAERFIEKSKHSEIKSNYINAGIYIFEPNVLKEIPDSQVVSIEKETWPLLLKKGYPIAVYKSDAYWMDIGTLEEYIQAHEDILSGDYPLSEIKGEHQNIFVGENTTIHSSTKIIGPTYIGENTKIAANSIIGPNTIIGNDCRVGPNNTIIDSIVWDKITLENNSTVSSVIINSDFMISNSNQNVNNVKTDALNKKIE